MTADRRALLNGHNANDATGGDAHRTAKNFEWNMQKLKFILNILLVFTCGFLAMSFVSQWVGVKFHFIPSWNQSNPVFSSAVNKQLHVFLNSTQNGDDLLSKPHENFYNSESFKSFVKNKHENFSSVEEYLLSVKDYLLTFRSPMIREEPSRYSWPETDAEKKQRDSTSGTKHIVWYNPPWHVTSNFRDKFGHCPVKDCVLSLNYNRDHTKADAVVFLGGPGKAVPLRDHASQIYIFYTMESPWHTNSGYRNTGWNKAFNWTWNFRIDSDLFEPVGYLKRPPSVPSHNTLLNMKRQKKKYVAWMSSNCNVQSKRDQYVKRLQKIIPVDIYGHCGNLSCKRNEQKCDTLLNDYLFYLSFENSMCFDYITEKFYKTFFEGTHVLSVVRGGGNYSRFFPAGTFIDAEAFSGPEELGRYLLELAQDEVGYVDMLWRRAHFVYHEHGIIDSYCQLCYKLHHVGRFQRTYSDMYGWYHRNGCSSPKPF